MNTKDQLGIVDKVEINLNQTDQLTNKKQYVVVSDGLHKNSKIYKSGELVWLDELTAKNFLREGNIKEVSNA